jgi:peptide/nickel transport system permease protein
VTTFKGYLVKRLGFISVTLLVISFLTFGATQLLPGNTARLMLGRQATEENVQALQQQLGLDRPWYVQYGDWLVNFVTGDWGVSLINSKPVVELVIPRLIKTAQLAVIALLLVVAISIPLGIYAAIKRDSLGDLFASTASYIGISIPEFVTGTLLLLLFGGPIFSVLPYGGFTPISEGVVPWAEHLILPSVTLTILLVAHMMRLTRSEVIEVLQSDYVRTARLKGLGEMKVLSKHVLRNALMAPITLLALDVGYLLGGVVVVEEVFSFPGLGSLIVSSIQTRDLPTLQAAILVIAFFYTFANLGADLLYTYLDPRIGYGGD